MARKKAIGNEPAPNMVPDTQQAQGDAVTINDFIVPQKVDAFCKAYRPCTPMDEGNEGIEVFTDARLRQFFKAWLCPIGDPLVAYLEMLAVNGFEMGVDIVGEPAIFAVPR